MDPKTVLQNMKEKYLSMGSYSDRGEVLTFLPDGDILQEVLFSSYFNRPDMLRFEWTTHHPFPPLRHLKNHSVIYKENGIVYVYSEKEDKKIRSENIEMAIAGATGLSNGAAHSIFTLLLPNIGGFRLYEIDLSNYHIGTFEGIECHIIRGKHPNGLDIELNIGVNDFLIRKVQTIDWNGTVQEEIRRNIIVNKRISDELFELYFNER